MSKSELKIKFQIKDGKKRYCKTQTITPDTLNLIVNGILRDVCKDMVNDVIAEYTRNKIMKVVK